MKNSKIGSQLPKKLLFIGVYCRIEDKDNPQNLELCLGYHVSGRFLKQFFPVELCSSNPKKVLNMLYSRGFKTTDKEHAIELIQQFAEIDNVPNKHWTNRPGWHDGMYVYPDPHREQEIMFRADKSVRVRENNRVGDIETLQETLKPLQYSSRIVLAIGLAFVAYLLRLLNLPPIAAIFYGRSSRGKSFLQYAAASISGTIGIQSNGGLVSFASSETAIEEFIKGSNDDSLHVDELGSSGLSDKDLSKAMTRIAFKYFDENGVNRGATYENNTKTAIFTPLSTATFTNEKPVVFERSGSALRAFQLPAARTIDGDIFDHKDATQHIGTPGDERGKYVIKTRQILRENQGHIKPLYIRRIQNNPNALVTAKNYADAFTEATLEIINIENTDKNVNGRIQHKFSYIYAALMLAIDFKLLPWGRKRVFNAIKLCLKDTIDCLPAEKPATQPVVPLKSSDEALEAFEETWVGMRRLCVQTTKAIPPQSLNEAEVFYFPKKRNLAHLFLVKPECMKKHFDDSVYTPLMELFKKNGVLVTKRADSHTKQFQIRQIGSKRSYYFALDATKLTELIGEDNCLNIEVIGPKRRKK